MKKAIWLITLIFAFLIPNIFAHPDSTFGGQSNPSLISADYNATCGNFLNGVLANPCNNQSGWKDYTTASKVRMDVGQNQVSCVVTANGGSGGGDNAGRFYTGGLYNKIPEGYCVSFRVGRSGTLASGTSLQVIWSPDVTGSTTATRIWANGGTSPAFCGAGDGFWNVGTDLCVGTATTFSLPNVVAEDYQNITFCQNSTTINGVIYANNSNTGSTNQGNNLATNTGNLTFYCQDGGASVAGDNITFKDIFIYPQTGAPQVVVPDTTPPNITYYNLTNEDGCESWINDKDTAFSTSSVTPTVQFNTDENAWCAIAG